MRFNNQSTFNGRQITNVVDRPILHKKGKQWITIGLSTLLLAGLGTVATTGGVHAANIQNNNVNSNNINKINSNAAPNSAKPSTITSQATNLHKQILNNSAMFQHNNSSATKPTVAPIAKVNPNSTSSTDSNNVKSNVGATSANNSDSNASTPNYIENKVHYNLGSYNSRKPVSTEAQSNAYQAYLKANPQLANLYNETANQSSSNNIDSSNVVSNAPKDNVSASSIASNSSASSVSANNSKISSANQISDKKNKPLMKVALNLKEIQNIGDTNIQANGTWGTAPWKLDKQGTLTIGSDNGAETDMQTNNWPTYFTNNNYANQAKIDSIICKNVKAPRDSSDLFGTWNDNETPKSYKLQNLKTIDVSGLHTSDVVSMKAMFGNTKLQQNTELTKITGLSDFNTSNVTSFVAMFAGQGGLPTLNLSSFDMRKARQQGGDYGSSFLPGPQMYNLILGPNTYLSPVNDGNSTYPWFNQSSNTTHVGIPSENGESMPGSWFNISGSSNGYWNNSQNQNDAQGSAFWLQDKNGDLFISNGWINHNIKSIQRVNWNSVQKIYFNNVHWQENSSPVSDAFINDINGITEDYNNINNYKSDIDKIADNTNPNWSDASIISTTTSNINNEKNNIANDLLSPNNNTSYDASKEASMASSAYNNADIENLVASQGAKYSSEIGSADKIIQSDQNYINWLKSSETSLTNASNSASSESNWIQNSGNSAYNSATNADSWVKNNSQSESNASGKASDNSNAISSLVSGLNHGNASATIQNAINSAVNSTETSANGALDNKATTAQINSLFNSGHGTISSVASTVAHSLAGSLASVYETQNAAGSKANSSDITNLTKSGGTIDSVASSYANSIATNYASSAVNWVSNYGSNASKVGSWYANNSGKLTSMVNSASTAYLNASNAISSLTNEDTRISANSNSASSFSNELSSLSNDINTKNTGIKDEITTINNNIDSTNKSSGLSALASDYKNLNTDITKASGIASQASTAYNWVNSNGATVSNRASTASASASNNANAIANLKDNTAITFTFTGANSDTIPATMTNGYIKANGKQVSGNTYDITNLLNEEVASKSKHVLGTYTITLGNDNNGNATVSYHAPQKKLAKVGVEATKPNNDMNTFKLGTPSQQNRVWNFVQNGLGRKGLTLGGSNSVPASTDTAHNVVLANNQAEYEGIITLNFGKNKSTQLTFDTGANNSDALASDSINLLNYAKNAQNPSDFTKDNLINGFDTTGFKFDSTTSTPNNKYNFTIQPSDATNQTGADIHSNYNITLNYTAQPVTEKINYEYKNSKNSLVNEGSTTASASDDTSSAWTTSSGASAGWELSNTSTPFTYTNSGSVNVMVKPMHASVTVNYINQKGSNVGTQTFRGNDYRASAAGSNGINITSANDTSLASGYSLNSANNNFSYNNSSVNVSVTGHDLKPASQITPDNNTNPSDANNNHSGKDMPQPSSKDDNVLFTIKIQDWNSDGTQKLGSTYTKYATETGDIGNPFTINPQDYLTYGFNMKSTKKGSVSDKSITGIIGDTHLQPNSTTFNFYAKPYNKNAKVNPTDPTTPKPITVQYVGESNGKSGQVINTYSNILTGSTGTTGDLSNIESATKGIPQGYTVNTNPKYNDYKYTINTVPSRVITVYLNSKTAKQMNNGGQNYKPATPSDKPSSKVPSDNTIKKDGSHGFATIIINENINGKVAHQSAQTVDESNRNVGSDYNIEPTSFTPNGYQVDSKDQALTGTVNPDGSLSNGSATFTYDVNDSEIAPISITYYNQYGDLIDRTTGKSSRTGENVNQSQATQTISAIDLAKLGAISDYVDITGFLEAPKGHHFYGNVKNITDSNGKPLNHVQLLEAKNHNPAHLGLTLFEAMPAPKPTSNSNSANASTSASAASAETSASNAVASAKANESEAISENNSVNASKASQSAMEIASMFANNVASASNAVANADNTSATDSIEIRSLIAEINTESKNSNSSNQPIYNITINNEPKATASKNTSNNVITPINHRIPVNLYYVYNPENITLHSKNNSIKISRRRGFTGKIIKATKFNGKRAYVVRWHHKNYVVNAKQVHNAYIQVKDFNRMAHGLIKHATIVLRKNARIYNSIHFNKASKVADVKAGSKFTVIGVKQFGEKGYHQTRLVLSNGLIITANRNYVKFV